MTSITIGLLENIAEDMLIVSDIPLFCQYLRKALEREPKKEEEITFPDSAATELGMVVTRPQQLQQDAF